MLRQHHPRKNAALCVLALVVAFGAPALALEDPLPAQITPPADLPELPASLIVDETPLTAQPDADFIMKSHNAHELRLRHRHMHQHQLHRRKEESSEEDKKTKTQEKDSDKHSDKGHKTSTSDHEKGKSSAEPTKTITEDPDSLKTQSLSAATSSGSATPSSDPDAPLPVPFDGTLASEFDEGSEDSTCSDFITALLKDDQFGQCYPVSMLIMKSNSFFNAKKQITSMVRVLDAGCKADVDSCTDFMTQAATNLTQKENCKKEYDDGLSTVLEAYNGLKNYELMYSATCLQDKDTDQYCYASAVTNSSSSSDSYVYFLPYNLDLPGSSTPSCNYCNKETMDIFRAASAHRDLLISKTYEGAARIFNNLCDPDYVNGTMPEAVTDRGLALVPSWAIMAGTLSLAGVFSALL